MIQPYGVCFSGLHVIFDGLGRYTECTTPAPCYTECSDEESAPPTLAPNIFPPSAPSPLSLLSLSSYLSTEHPLRVRVRVRVRARVRALLLP